MPRKTIEVSFVLSIETVGRCKAALKRVQDAQTNSNGKIVDFRIENDNNGNPQGVIGVEVDFAV